MGDSSRSKTARDLGRSEAAQQFQTLAQQLRAGAIVMENRSYPVPDQVRLVLGAKGGELEVEVKWQTAAAQTGPEEFREEDAIREMEPLPPFMAGYQADA